MSNVIPIQIPQRKPSAQMRAVLMILEADSYLKKTVLPFVDVNRESINWEPIFKMPFGSGHKAAVTWAYAVWTDEVRMKSNPFDGALSLSPALQRAVLQALALRWGMAL
jgi:hypothetical protein